MDVPLKPLRLPLNWQKTALIDPLQIVDDTKINLLLVDDQAANLFALESLLENVNYNIVKVFSGPEALRCMLQQDFAIVLLDVLMPGMDGFETAELIRRRPQSKHTPIIFITAGSSNETHVSRGYSLGAVDYIYKPIIPEILKTKVQVFVELYRKSESLLKSEEALRRQLAEYKKLEEARRDSEIKYRELFSRANEAILVFDAESDNVIDANRAALKLYGYTRLELSKLTAQDLLTEPQTPGHLNLPATTDGGTSKHTLLKYQKKRDGTIFPAEITHGAFSLKGKKMRMILTRDMTERLIIEEGRRLREREALQRQLLATVSHELRTPIAAIKASAETLRRDGVVNIKSQPRFVKIIESHANRLAWLVEDLLTVAEFESGKTQPEPRMIPLRTFTQQFIREITPLAARRNITIQVDMQEETTIWIDQAHLTRILQNLLDNAIKYNKKGGTIHIKEQKIDDRYSQISIRDSGIGIPPKDIPLIFQQFHRTEGARAHADRGTGLGLYIIKAIIESNGGRIWAESEKGQGSVFHFTIPLARAVETRHTSKKVLFVV